MLGGYAAHDHHGTDQAKEGLVRTPAHTVRNGTCGVHDKLASFGLSTVRYRGRDAHAMRSLLERR